MNLLRTSLGLIAARSLFIRPQYSNKPLIKPSASTLEKKIKKIYGHTIQGKPETKNIRV